jgi:hypothetical protein
VHCDAPISAIRLDEALSKNNGVSIDDDQDNVVNAADAHTAVAGGACQPVPYSNFGFAGLDFPPGYTPATGTVHHVETFTPTSSACAPPPPPGGGGCAIASPSSSADPAADRPRVIVCP